MHSLRREHFSLIFSFGWVLKKRSEVITVPIEGRRASFQRSLAFLDLLLSTVSSIVNPISTRPYQVVSSDVIPRFCKIMVGSDFVFATWICMIIPYKKRACRLSHKHLDLGHELIRTFYRNAIHHPLPHLNVVLRSLHQYFGLSSTCAYAHTHLGYLLECP